MKILKVTAIILFALIFTYSVSCYLWCNFTPQGKQKMMERSKGPAASHILME